MQTRAEYALWSSGELLIHLPQVISGDLVELSREDTKRLLDYLDRMREPEEAAPAIRLGPFRS